MQRLPRGVREEEHLWIPMRDGCRLAARMWLPEGAERDPVPAVVEYIPYGKREGTRDRDEPMHAYFAGHGFAALRIDLRGSGESDGLLVDEYTPQELADGCDALAWVAAQPWCSGSVGLIGISWGGFNGLQLAALRPPALGAVISVCSTDDRYADDAHYMGGCLLNDNLYWGATFFQLMVQPPDPALVGESWRDTWRARLEAAEPPPARWLRHPLRDDYWRHGSVCEDYASIACPVFAVGGWADAYHNAVPRLMAGLRAPARGLVGPWGHRYPHQGAPGPAIGFLQEAVAWWDRWLRGGPPDGEPAYRVWMQDSVPAGFDGDARPGRWVAESAWPSPRIQARTLSFGKGRLGARAARGERLVVRSPQTTGASAGGWLVAQVLDQREDDAASLCFDGEPLDAPFEVLGAPEVRLALAADRPTAFVAVRLLEVAPDGSSSRVSHGFLNLTHREGHDRMVLLTPGERVEVTVALNHVAHAFPPGHRLRVAVSPTWWPMIWPSPEPVALTLFPEGCALVLPVRPVHPDDARLRPFGPPEAAPVPRSTRLTRGGRERLRTTDPASGDLVTRLRSGFVGEAGVGLSRYDAVGMESGDALEVTTRIHPEDPLRARVAMRQLTELRRPGWSVAVRTEATLSCTRESFRLEARLEALEGGERVLDRRFDEEIPRRGI